MSVLFTNLSDNSWTVGDEVIQQYNYYRITPVYDETVDFSYESYTYKISQTQLINGKISYCNIYTYFPFSVNTTNDVYLYISFDGQIAYTHNPGEYPVQVVFSTWCIANVMTPVADIPLIPNAIPLPVTPTPDSEYHTSTPSTTTYVWVVALILFILLVILFIFMFKNYTK